MTEPFDPELGQTVLEPEEPGAGHWVGAPSVLRDAPRDRILLAYRRRRPRPARGHECRIAESSDGVRFSDVWSVRNDELATESMERFCLRRARGGGYLLYLSYVDPADGRWRIDVVGAEAPEGFRVEERRAVFTAAGTGTAAVKDPYVVRAGEVDLMFVSTFLTDAGPAPTFLGVSEDGVRFRWAGELLPVGTGWDRYQARLGSVVPTADGFAGFYDGASSADEDTEERCGLAWSTDLRRWRRLSTEEPWVVSPHATGSLRYVDAVEVEAELLLYYEYARPDGSHELRVSRLSGEG